MSTRSVFVAFACLLTSFMVCSAWAGPSMLYLYNAPESNADTRNDYTWQVLRTALERTRKEYGDFEMKATSRMSESRQIHEMKSAALHINTMILPSRNTLLNVLVPVRIPVDRGLLGFRVFLIRAEDQPRFDAINSLEALRAITIGQGFDWVDLKILGDAGLQVESGPSYEGLFSMLMARRFDAFSRSITEADHELAERKAQMPDMAIEKHLLLYYPMPAYFWFPNTADGKLRAKRVETGLMAMIADGSLKRMFFNKYGSVIQKLNIKQRRLIRIENSQLGPDEPLKDVKLWYSPNETEN